MNEINKSLLELLSMLRTAKPNLQKAKPETIMMVQKGKGNGKGKKKMDSKSKGKPKLKNDALKLKGRVANECKCFHCSETRHWKTNCKVYLKI